MTNSLLLPLIKKFREQDMTAFSIIYDEFKKLIYLYSGRLVDDDAVQDLTLFLLELLYGINLSKFHPDSSDTLKRYIAVSIKNKYISLSKERQKLISTSVELCDDLLINSESVFEGLDICEALKVLTLRQRLIIIYRYIYCYSDAEISSLLSISRQAVNRLKNRAIKTLQEFYFEKG